MGRRRKSDFTNEQFGRLTVTGEGESKEYKQRMFRCECECGCLIDTSYSALVNGMSKSCGCLRRDMKSRKFIYGLRRRLSDEKNGISRSPTQLAWEFMIEQVANMTKQRSSPSVIGAGKQPGIKRAWWLDHKGIENEIGECPSKCQHYIERIDKSRGFTTGNIQWSEWSY